MKNYKRSLSESDQARNNSDIHEPTNLNKFKYSNEYDSSIYLQPFWRPIRPYVSSSKLVRSNFGMSREELNTVVKNLAALEKSLDSSSRNTISLSKSKSKPKKRSKDTKKRLNKSAKSSKGIPQSSIKGCKLEYSFTSQ